MLGAGESCSYVMTSLVKFSRTAHTALDLCWVRRVNSQDGGPWGTVSVFFFSWLRCRSFEHETGKNTEGCQATASRGREATSRAVSRFVRADLHDPPFRFVPLFTLPFGFWQASSSSPSSPTPSRQSSRRRLDRDKPSCEQPRPRPITADLTSSSRPLPSPDLVYGVRPAPAAGERRAAAF